MPLGEQTRKNRWARPSLFTIVPADSANVPAGKARWALATVGVPRWSITITLAAEAKIEPVRNEIKHRVDLMLVDPDSTVRDMVRVRQVEYCLLERWDKSESQIESLSVDELWPEIMVNSLHYDTPEVWNDNLRRIDLLLRKSNLHRLRIGTSEEDILKTVNQLW